MRKGELRLGNLREVTQLGAVRSRLKPGFLGHQASCYLIKLILFFRKPVSREKKRSVLLLNMGLKKRIIFPNLLLVFYCESRRSGDITVLFSCCHQRALDSKQVSVLPEILYFFLAPMPRSTFFCFCFLNLLRNLEHIRWLKELFSGGEQTCRLFPQE